MYAIKRSATFELINFAASLRNRRRHSVCACAFAFKLISFAVSSAVDVSTPSLKQRENVLSFQVPPYMFSGDEFRSGQSGLLLWSSSTAKLKL